MSFRLRWTSSTIGPIVACLLSCTTDVVLGQKPSGGPVFGPDAGTVDPDASAGPDASNEMSPASLTDSESAMPTEAATENQVPVATTPPPGHE